MGLRGKMKTHKNLQKGMYFAQTNSVYHIFPKLTRGIPQKKQTFPATAEKQKAFPAVSLAVPGEPWYNLLLFADFGGLSVKKALRIILPVSAVILIALLAVLFLLPGKNTPPWKQTGWIERDGQHYYLDPEGNPMTGWHNIEGKRYCFDSEGVMLTGWVEENGQRKYLDSTGILRTGWLSDGGQDYYMLSDGSPASGWQNIEGKLHYFNADGTPRPGWAEKEGIAYYILPSGKVATGWQEIDGVQYFLNSDGTPYTGWLTTSDGTLYISQTGTVATGWVDTEDGRYCFDEKGAPLNGWQEADGSRYYLDETGRAVTGWMEENGTRYFMDETGASISGWLDWSGNRYFFDESGAAVTGWLEQDGNKYYLTASGVVRGKYLIDDVPYYFTSTGANIILVNPWNSLPEDFTVDLVQTTGGWVAPECKEPLEQMLADCRAAGFSPQIVSSYRSIADQRVNLANMVASMNGDYAAATKIVAVPGTSEHHLGLALDIVDSAYPKLNHQQENMPTQKWLMENCWKYGFIMRYPANTTEITGIIYEPWHYRYVGLELAKEIHDLDNICLEVYIDQLTNDGTTCGGKLVTTDN